MSLIKKVIGLFRFLRKARKQILPDFDELNKEIISLKGIMAEFEKRVVSLQQDREEAHDDILDLKGKGSNLKQAIDFIKTDIDRIRNDVSSLQNQIAELNKIVSELKGRYENIEDSVITKIENRFLKSFMSKIKGLLDKK